VKVNFFDFGVGTHHEVLAPERDRERSIGLQWAALNVWVMDRLQIFRMPTIFPFFETLRSGAF
uniref:hypothetical protein n=1 Tax=Pseudomonas sp. RL_5y_Pfl2_73 TaxID=3088713 RepID=UPI0030DA43C3